MEKATQPVADHDVEVYAKALVFVAENCLIARMSSDALTCRNAAALLSRLARERDAAEKRAERDRDLLKRMDEVIDDYSCVRSCINPLEDLKRAIAALKSRAESCEAQLKARDENAARYLDAIFAMADDGWLMHGEEGMSDVQEAVFKIVQEHPEYKRRVEAARSPARGEEG